jgi:hypothetical protein
VTTPTAHSSGAVTATPTPVTQPPNPVAPRDPDLILARIHLLLGSLSLARTELETLAGMGTLDDEAIRDLAEARWRTGDLVGAGEAATAWLESHPDDVLGLVISAESQAAIGRPTEARRLAGRAVELADGSLDPVFAGMQRSAVWPVEAGTAIGPVGVLFDDLHPGPHVVRPVPPARSGAVRGAGEDRTGTGIGTGIDPFEPGVPAALLGGPSLWGDDTTGTDAAEADLLDPSVLFHRARVALETGQTGDAATGLILALRASPSLAPAILDLLAGRGEPILALVRGDAQRIVGREVEAMRDHATAVGSMIATASTTHEAPASAAGTVATDTELHVPPTAGADDNVESNDAPTTPAQENS